MGLNGQLDTGTQIDGATDNTAIGNVGDSLKTTVTSSALPAGAATAANQTTEIASLSSIDAGIPATLGQTTMSASMPVVIASNQTAIAVTATISGTSQEAEFATFNVTAHSVAIGNNKSMLSIVNTTGSVVKIKLRHLKIINAQTTPVTGVISNFTLLKCVTHSAGTSITPVACESSDTLSSSVTVRTGATIGTEGTDVLRRVQYSTDEWGVGSTDVESLDHIMQIGTNILETPLKAKPFTLLANEGITLKQTINSTIGLFDIELMFTQE